MVAPDTLDTWIIMGGDTGTVSDDGAAGVTFSGVENLTGAADNEDAFVFATGGSPSVAIGVARAVSLMERDTAAHRLSKTT